MKMKRDQRLLISRNTYGGKQCNDDDKPNV